MRSSTQDNLTNPLRVDPVDVPTNIPIWKTLRVALVTQEFYDRINIKDPFTAYHITDSKEFRVYIGDHLVNSPKTDCRYVVGPSDRHGEYIIYMNARYNHMDHLIPITKYDNPQYAIDALNKYQRTGSHHPLLVDTRACIISLITEDIPVHDFIMCIMSLYGYKDDPRLQDIGNTIHAYGVYKTKRKYLPEAAVIKIGVLAKSSNNELWKFYNEVYNVLLEFNFFQDKEYTEDPENVDFYVPTHKIATIFSDTILPQY